MSAVQIAQVDAYQYDARIHGVRVASAVLDERGMTTSQRRLAYLAQPPKRRRLTPRQRRRLEHKDLRERRLAEMRGNGGAA